VANQKQLDRLAALLQLLAVGGSCSSPPSNSCEEQLLETKTNMTWMELDPVDVEGTFSLLQSEDDHSKFSAVVGTQDDSPRKLPPEIVARKSAGSTVRQRRTPKRSLLNGNEKVSAEAKKEPAQPGTFLQPESQQAITGRTVHPY
jgi:hypothetical protein